MSTSSRTTTSSFGWFLLLIVEASGTLAAFWALLGARFSPENYQTALIVPDTVEFTVLGVALIVTACALVLCARHRDGWSALARGALPVAAISLFVLLKTLLMARIRMYDMLLF